MNKMDKIKAKAEAARHWEYVSALLRKVNDLNEFHYLTAFEHGYKHGWEDRDEQDTSKDRHSSKKTSKAKAGHGG